MTNEQKNAFYMAVGNHEGFRSTAYYCPSGCLTIGFGHRIADSERKQFATRKLTFREAFDLLTKDFENVFKFLAKQNFILQEHELFAVADLCFNVGCEKLSHRPIWQRIREYSQAIDNNQHFESDRLRQLIAERFLHYVHYTRNGKVYTSDGLLLRRKFDRSLWLGELYVLK